MAAIVVADQAKSCYGHAMDDRDEQLDSLRIRQLAALRRATNRSRSHAMIAAGVCAVTAVQCGIMMVAEVRLVGWGVRLLGYLACLILTLCGAIFFVRRARRLGAELKRTEFSPNAIVPDFSSLGDGTDLADKLNRIE